MTIVKQNFSALKSADNLKWDCSDAHQRSLVIFKFSGETGDEYKVFLKELGETLSSLKRNFEELFKEYESLHNSLFPKK